MKMTTGGYYRYKSYGALIASALLAEQVFLHGAAFKIQRLMPSIAVSNKSLQPNAVKRRGLTGSAFRSHLFSSTNPIPPSDQQSLENAVINPSLQSSGSSAQRSTKPTSQDENVTLLEKFDRMGLAMKPKAVVARDMASSLQESNKLKSIVYTCKACLLILLFILYRAYRGFFFLLPAVFKEVYDKLESAIESPFDEEDKNVSVDPDTEKVRLRTRITVSILSGLVTTSYMVGGACRVLVRFVKSLCSTSSVEKSFEAAADQVMVNEKQISKMASRNKTPTPPVKNGVAETKNDVTIVGSEETETCQEESEETETGQEESEETGDSLRP
jgi:hypothetical protein